MRKFLTLHLPLLAVGFVAGAAFWYLASPLWIDRVVSEPLPERLMVSETARGAFRDADAVHRASGVAAVLETPLGDRLLRFTEFQVTNGPDLKVWLTTARDPADSAAVKAGQFVSLGPLKGNIGDQTYVLPADLDLAAYPSVVIWCERFGVLFATATPDPAS